MYQSYREAIGDNNIVSDTGADSEIVWHCSCFPKTIVHINCKMTMIIVTINLYMSKGKSTAHPHSQRNYNYYFLINYLFMRRKKEKRKKKKETYINNYFIHST